MKYILTIILLISLLLTGCSIQPEITVNPETFVIVDRTTGEIYHPDLEPAPEIEGSQITFIQDGKAYIISGNWIIEGELK